MIEHLAGRRCAQLRLWRHRPPGGITTQAVALEITWDDATVLTLDVNADWTLGLAGARWAHPLAGATDAERDRLADLGTWQVDDSPADLDSIVGRMVTAVEPYINEVGELSGLTIVFEGTVVRALVFNGELRMEVDA